MVAFISDALSVLKDYLSRAYDIIKGGLDKLMEIVQWFFDNFPYDNPTKTTALAVIFFMTTVGLILVFSSTPWESGGVTDTDKKISFGWEIADIAGEGGEDGDGGDTTPPTIPTPQPTGPNVCMSHADCEVDRETGEALGTKCCLPEKTEGWWCSGYCLKESRWGEEDILDVCAHPAACDNPDKQALQEYLLSEAGDNSGICLGRSFEYPSQYCRSKYSDTVSGKVSLCCADYVDTQGFPPCYGFCTTEGNLDCYDIHGCYDDSLDHTVYLIEPEDGYETA